MACMKFRGGDANALLAAALAAGVEPLSAVRGDCLSGIYLDEKTDGRVRFTAREFIGTDSGGDSIRDGQGVTFLYGKWKTYRFDRDELAAAGIVIEPET